MNKEKLAPLLIVIIFVATMSFLLVWENTDIKINTENQEIKINNIQYVTLASVKIRVELALTPAEQAQGLSGRQSLNENEGMLFVFDQPGKYYFWMQDMNFPIDIIWIAEEDSGDRKIVYIKKDAQPDLYLETYGSEKDAKYVLEVVSGFSEKNNLQVGDTAV